MKTLVGKNNYLFLQNDSNQELEVHNNNLCLVREDSFTKYEKYLHQYLFIVFPNKSFIHKEHLPDQYNLIYRPAFDLYNSYFKGRMVDLYPYLIKGDTFYKTDTHMNFNGAYISYQIVVDKINELFGLHLEKLCIQIRKTECILTQLNMGIGDLTWEINLGDQILESRNDTYYFTDESETLFNFNSHRLKNSPYKGLTILTYDLLDETSLHTGVKMDWNLVSKYIIHTLNPGNTLKKKVVIFYDSFLLSSLGLWMNLFRDVYFIKNTFDPELVEKIKPDYILEFRVERFLS
jgi:hypothetical protein